jgi:NAD(P)-dependent dehydrogenase (short-subunit alcohol dehydrogenase family)
MDLKGKVAIVTGAGTGIGREIALCFGREGASVVCCGRREALIEETAAILRREGGQGIAVQTDVADPSSVRQLLGRVIDEYGAVDLLFANAGSFCSVAPFWETDTEVWWGDVTVNLRGTMLCCRAVLPHMMARGSGVIITMDGGGGSDHVNLAGSAYGASKAAIVRFSEGLSRELEREGSKVLVFCMYPGFVDTEMTRGIAATKAGEKWQGFVGKWIRSGEGEPPDACARATLKLLRIACPELSGRVFSVETDFDEVTRRVREIQEKNLFVMRLRREKSI